MIPLTECTLGAPSAGHSVVFILIFVSISAFSEWNHTETAASVDTFSTFRHDSGSFWAFIGMLLSAQEFISFSCLTDPTTGAFCGPIAILGVQPSANLYGAGLGAGLETTSPQKYLSGTFELIPLCVTVGFILIRPTLNLTTNNLTFLTLSLVGGYILLHSSFKLSPIGLIVGFIASTIVLATKLFTIVLQTYFVCVFGSGLANIPDTNWDC